MFRLEDKLFWRYALAGSALASALLSAQHAEAASKKAKESVKAAEKAEILSASKPIRRSDTLGPSGVADDFKIEQGRWSFAFKSQITDFQDLRDGNNEVPIGDVNNLTGKGRYFYPTAPEKMVSATHILEGMYAPSRQLSIVATIPMHQRSVDYLTTAGGRFTNESQGMGDISVKGVVPLTGNQRDRWTGTVGFSVPTGKTNIKGRSPFAGAGQVRQPYAMQLGSGTVDLLFGVGYRHEMDNRSFGAKADFVFRTGDNGNGYRLGNAGEISAWSSWRVAKKWSSSLRLAARKWESIEGRDPSIPMSFGSLADPANYGGQRVDVGLGFNLLEPNNLINKRFNLELLIPVSQELSGPQLETKHILHMGYGKEW